jgi:hypothetical protein
MNQSQTQTELTISPSCFIVLIVSKTGNPAPFQPFNAPLSISPVISTFRPPHPKKPRNFNKPPRKISKDREAPAWLVQKQTDAKNLQTIPPFRNRQFSSSASIINDLPSSTNP